MPNLHVTGGARVAVELSNRMVARGHEFHILVPSGRYKLPYRLSADVIECGLKVGNPLLAIATGVMSMGRHIPPFVEVILACMPPYALLAQKIARKRGIPAVNYVLNDDVHFFDDRSLISSEIVLKIYRSLARRSIRTGPVFVNSHWTAVQCVKEGGVRPSSFVPHGYDSQVFYPKQTLEDNSNPVRLVTVGRRMRWKGFDDLIGALNLVDQVRYPFVLNVISQDDIDISHAHFPVDLKKPAVDEELAGLYRRGDIYIHSSWFEGFGMPPLEAQACGLAVVSTDSGGVREFLQDEYNALIVPPREPITLARAVERIISDQSLRRRLSSRGLETCVDFTWDRIADRFEEALRRLIRDY